MIKSQVCCFFETRSIKPNVCVMCLSVYFYVPYARPQFWADLHEIWHVESLYPPKGQGRVSERRSCPGLALRAPSIYAAANGWRAPSGNSEL